MPRPPPPQLALAGTLGAIRHPHCARVHPVKLVRGLAATVERLGVPIYEDTRVREISPGRAVTDRGTVRAAHVLRATEGFTADLRGEHRTWLPMNSSMIVTDPLPASAWAEIGWEGRETLGDFAHVYMYAQRTADDRIAFGGRGVPYRFGSRVDTDGSTQARTIASLAALLLRAGEPVAAAEAASRAIELAERMALPDPARIVRRYPHQLSGGQRQRVALAAALACAPRLIIADEPTTALDVTVQAGILTLLRDLVEDEGRGLLFITHDLAVLSLVATRGVVLHRGRVVEDAPVQALLTAPASEITRGLLRDARATSWSPQTQTPSETPQGEERR